MSDHGYQNVEKTGFDWDHTLEQLDSEILYTDDPDPITLLTQEIREQLPADFAADDEDIFGKLPTHTVVLTDDQTNLMLEIMRGAE